MYQKHRATQLAAAFLLVVAATAQAQNSLFDGIWHSNGHNQLLVIDGDSFTRLELTSLSCTMSAQATAEGNTIDLGIPARVSLQGNSLTLTLTETLTITHQRIPELPLQCARGLTRETDNPDIIFEVFWHTLNENYANFNQRGIDWHHQYHTYRSQIMARTDTPELARILCDMISLLHDAHTYLTNGWSRCGGAPPPAWVTGRGIDSFSAVTIDAYLGGETVQAGQSPISYGLLNDRVGYLEIRHMMGFADSYADEATAAGMVMAGIAEAFVGLDTVIVDVRFNPGGLDSVALALANHFADTERLAFSKMVRDGDAFTTPQEFFVSPAGGAQLTQDVIVLTSGATASAAEIFVMAMSALPHVTIVGERTEGLTSHVQVRTLPNGWKLALGNWRYLSPDGSNYERIGVPPDVSIAFDPGAFGEGRDAILDAALDVAGSGLEAARE